MPKERRIEPRTTLALPVSLADGACGLTRDISASGLFFETDWAPLEDPVLDLTLSLESPVGDVRFVAQGAVMRREQAAGRLGVAVKLLAMRMERSA